ncbi:hypothetical protein K523DRAFT_323469 [Schizophyllum commune Tattone D]|nr:hypothetical protein K523DRAFT_323469 [Schizophyllum commune Tattone D]
MRYSARISQDVTASLAKRSPTRLGRRLPTWSTSQSWVGRSALPGSGQFRRLKLTARKPDFIFAFF